ncbi:uncharacterized protein tp53i13 [Pelmatolapia mariae]|uniref:uncharacterized protein tp53i13 n=1 Tax=Pelmatolapia mariae TaxID=158779 RepID=UPI002FE51841
MPREATSPPLTVTVLAALWVSVGRCDVFGSLGQGCDNGKLSLDRDLPADAVYWDCAASAWPEFTQRLPSIDTVYNPEPARQICMDKSISYYHRIPNSGAYRPIGAESGEYLYCPPQRWLNNLQHGAAVLLYHPCAPPRERQILSDLARSCLQSYIMTPHPQLSKHMPVAFVSWGRTLELSTAASLDVCDWLEVNHRGQTSRKESDAVTQMRKYALLLTWSAELHQLEQTTKMKDSLRQCCERTIYSLLSGATEAELEHSVKTERSKQTKVGSKTRQMRAALKDREFNVDSNESNNTMADVSETVPQRSGDGQNNSSTLGSSAGQRKRFHLSSSREAPQVPTQASKPWLTAPLALNMSETEAQKGLRKLNHSAVSAHGVSSKRTFPDRPEALALKETDSIKHNIKVDNSKEKILDSSDGNMEDNEVIDVKERELEHTQIHSAPGSHQKSESTGSDSVPKPQSEAQAQQHPQAASHSQPITRDCNSCTPGEHCGCAKASGSEAQAAAAVVRKELQRTPRTDEAMWAAAALGFLLVLLTLSVLHTRLYRHWRITPSLYWHNPSNDYDSVADVIRRRLRIAKRRRKRGRRQECVLLPSSSSSDECP